MTSPTSPAFSTRGISINKQSKNLIIYRSISTHSKCAHVGHSLCEHKAKIVFGVYLYQWHIEIVYNRTETSLSFSMNKHLAQEVGDLLNGTSSLSCHWRNFFTIKWKTTDNCDTHFTHIPLNWSCLGFLVWLLWWQFCVGEMFRTVLLQLSFTKGTITWTHHLNRHWRSVEIKKAGFSDDVDDLRIIELRMVFVVQ